LSADEVGGFCLEIIPPFGDTAENVAAMPTYQESNLLDVSRQFQIYGDLLHADLCKIGHINETYIATYDQGGIAVRYVHQKINTNVFKNSDAVMDNMVRVTSHQRRKLVEK